MAKNLTGKPNTQDYFLGRGKIYLSPLNASTSLPGAYRDLGNCPAFAIQVESEELLHQSSMTGTRVTDKRVTLSQDISFTFSLDEISHENLSLFFGGAVTSITNPAVAGVGTMMAPISITDDVELGRWYDLKTAYDGSGNPVAFSAASVPQILYDDGGGAAAATIDVDFEIDHKMGRVFVLANASNISAGDELLWYSAANAAAPATLDLMAALDGTNQDYALKFISENPANGDEQIEYHFHSVQVAADGDFALIGDEYTQASFSGTAQQNSVEEATLTVRSSVRS